MAERRVVTTQIPLGNVLQLLRRTIEGGCSVPLWSLLRLMTGGNALRAELATRDGISPSELGLSIDVELVPGQRMLTIRDDGVGLQREELARCFEDAFVPSGVSLDLPIIRRDPRTEQEYHQSISMSLMYLLPFAEVISLDSLSMAPGSEACRLVYSGGDDYIVEPGDIDAPGLSVSLRFVEELAELTDPERLPGLLRSYGDFLQFPVFYEGSQINTMSPPWHRPDTSVTQYSAFLRSREPDVPPPLLVIPLHLQRPELTLCGVLWVPGHHLSVLDDALSCVDLYWRRLLVARDVPHLLPGWARFFRGIVDCDVFPRSLAEGRTIGGGPGRIIVPDVLEQVILTGIRRALILDRESFSNVAHQHNHLVKLAALESDEFFEIVADQLQFDTTAGPRTLLEHVSSVMQMTGAAGVHYLPSDPFGYMASYRTRKAEVIDATHGLDEEILKKYDRHNPTIELVDMGRRVPDFVQEIVDPSFDAVVRLFESLDIPAVCRLARLDAPSPAAFVANTEAEGSTADLEQLFLLSQITGAMPADARAAMQRALSAKSSRGQLRVLHLNVLSPVIRALRAALEKGVEEELVRQVAEATIVRAMVLGGGPVDADRIHDVGSEIICRVLGYEGEDGLQLSEP